MFPETAQHDMPSIDSVMPLTNAKAARIEERCNYVVTGLVLTHRALQKRAIVDKESIRWYPNDDEYSLMMAGRKLTPGPGVPPPEAIGDDLLAAPVEVTPIVLAAPAASSRPVLTAPPSAKLLETTEAALGELARELGCVFNDDVPHNAGWFVPGKPKACASAYDAIRGLFASLEAGGTVYRPSAVPPAAEPVSAPKKAKPLFEAPQGALF